MDTLTMPQKTKVTSPRNLKARLAYALAKALMSDLARGLARILTKPPTRAQKDALSNCVFQSMLDIVEKYPMTKSQKTRLMHLIDNQKEHPLRALMSILPPDQVESMIMDFEKDLLNALANPVKKALKNLLGNLEKKKKSLVTFAKHQAETIQGMQKNVNQGWQWVKAVVVKVLDFLKRVVEQATVAAIAQILVQTIMMVITGVLVSGIPVPMSCLISNRGQNKG